MTSTVSPSQLGSSAAIASLLLDNKNKHADWEEKQPAPTQPATTTEDSDATITGTASTTARTCTPSSVSFSLTTPSHTSPPTSGRTLRHRRRRAHRTSPSHTPIFTRDELTAQKLKRNTWINQQETTLQHQRDLARQEKERVGNRWLVVVLLLWILVIVLIVGCVGRSLLEGQGRQQVRVRSTEAWRQGHGIHRVERAERITSMLERDW